MNIYDLPIKSISIMSRDLALRLVLERRAARMTPTRKSATQSKKIKKSNIAVLSKLTDAQKQELLRRIKEEQAS